jgi:cobalamin synthase
VGATALAIGMLSVLPVPAVTSPSAQTRRNAMLLAPAVGLVLGLITGGIVALALISPGDAPLSYIPYVVGAWLLIGIPLALIVGGKAVAAEQSGEPSTS